ncbi:MAG: S-layer homology domain-containing protein [Oscillospiraceae bacterium]|nr:S-layer homology domain-containing protein [Oscillospiraceae bacterium]
MKKRLFMMMLALTLLSVLCAAPSSAKTVSSARADNVFFYVLNSEGRSVLLKVMPLSELRQLSHGRPDGRNYYISSTDNYPAAQYCECRGFTVSELLEHVRSVTAVPGAEAVSFSGEDTLRLMATDSYGNYSRSWTARQLYGVKRYYFEGLYDGEHGWKNGWEIAGEDNSKFGITLEDYYRDYKDADPYYDDKRAVFDSGEETEVIFATSSYSGRTAGETLIASTEPGLAGCVRENGGVVGGCLGGLLSEDYALRLSLPMTEADLMAAHRTAYDNFKWIYNMRLDMENAPDIVSLGTVAEPTPSFTLSGGTLTVAFTCATPGATIYTGDDGAPQTPYTGPFTIDVADRDLSADPVTVYAAAVKEGWDDAGVLTFKYPGMAPTFRTVYSGMTGAPLTFTAAESVSVEEWTAWTKALLFVSMKTPLDTGYAVLDADSYTVDDAEKTVTFDGGLFTQSGSCSFIFHASKYADKRLSVTVKQPAPAPEAEKRYPLGEPITVRFDSVDYNDGLSVYVVPENGTRTMISAGFLDRTQPGQVTVKAEYFALASSAMSEPGVYTIELVNNRFSPSAQTVTVRLGGCFYDVPESAWYYGCVTELAERGIVNGAGGGMFCPGGTLTYGQAMRLLLVTAGCGEQERTGGHWASGFMDKAAAEGLIPGDVDPDAPISRLSCCRAAAKLSRAEAAAAASPFADTSDPAVIALWEKGVIDGVGGGLFDPDDTLTRAQISKIIWCLIRSEEGL